MTIRIFPPDDFLEARVTLPLSKSMSARQLIISALTPGAQLPVDEVAVCDDTDMLVKALSHPDATDINVGAAGTTMRFLTAYYATRPSSHPVRLDGSERMRQRPIAPLVESLRALGADITYEGAEGFPPLIIKGKKLSGGRVEIDATKSSQYISALLMVAPTMDNGLELKLLGEPASKPYILMTLKMMADAGVEGELYDGVVTVPAGSYHTPTPPRPVEGDWSAAAVWYEAVALSGGIITVDNLAVEHSVQGDSALAQIYGRLGVDTLAQGDEGLPELSANPDADARANIDFSDNPDLAQYLVVTCTMLGIPFRFTGLSTLAVKETDRVEALRTELAKTGVFINVPVPGVMEWDGMRRPIAELPVFDTHDDHRMAMCLAPVALFMPGIGMRHPEVVSKSYPGFWDQLQNAGFKIVEEKETEA
ncbi:MAG: 3-phosphoshikimate 1-carboxyvinyltransferase [Muribaculaceae bacterium]|nr:3-phosphoshikimate 1-carboxyvinyltransferase [Muribaculaceae bacterium]